MSTLLLSGIPPGTGGVGEILLQEMLSCIGNDQVSFAGLMSRDYLARAEVKSFKNLECFVPPHEFARRDAPGIKGTITTIHDRITRYEPAIKALGKSLLPFIQRVKPQRIWAVLNSTVTIDACEYVARRINTPFFVHVWDDPQHILTQRQLDRYTRSRTLRRFTHLLKTAKRIGVICENMRREYAHHTNADTFIIRHGITDKIDARSDPTSESEFRIGISGSMYAYSAWKALQLALDSLDWRIQNKRVVLVSAGSEINFLSYKPAEARFYGWRSMPEVIDLLTQCDVLYLPQPFELLQTPLAKLSFPTKLSTYVSTGRPVFIHSPTHGSLTDFSAQHSFGLLSGELNPVVLGKWLSTVCSSQETLAEQSRASARIGETVLCRSEFERSTRAFLS